MADIRGERRETYEPRPPGETPAPDTAKPNGAAIYGKVVNGARAEPRSLRLINFMDATLPDEAEYLVRGVLPRSGFALLWGAEKSGKSFVAFDLVMHVALDREYRGRRVQQGAVVYVAAEGGQGFRKRIVAFRQEKLAESFDGQVPFYLAAERLDLTEDREALVAAIKATIGEIKPSIIVLDTLNRTYTGSESADDDMRNYLRAVDALREEFDCLVLVVHHCGHGQDRPRGHSSLLGAYDALLKVEKLDDGSRKMIVQELKDGESGATFYSSLAVITVGDDEDGDEITSLVVEEADAPEGGGGDLRKGKRLSAQAKVALDALERAIANVGQLSPGGENMPSGIRVCTLQQWSDYAKQIGVSDSPSDEAVRKAMYRAKLDLQNARIVGVWHKWVWIAK